jgi:hypothetical protein
MEIQPVEQRIKELCEKAVTADDSEVPALIAELQALLAGHSQFFRYLAARTMNRVYEKSSSSKAAD